MAQVERLHQILLWPLRLLRSGAAAQTRRPWEVLQGLPGHPWREVLDEYTGDPDKFHERHYQEFLTFLPYVQRVLFGEGRSSQQGDDCLGESGMKTLRRSDVAFFEIVTRPGRAPLRLQVVHIDLIFFYDIDAVLLNVELAGAAIELSEAQELLYRCGRAYPAGWDEHGMPLHCLAECRFLDAEGGTLVASDTRDREPYIEHVQARRAPRIARHWAWLLEPLVPEHGDQDGPLRYRQIEYYRMPVMAYLAVDDPHALSRSDFVRLGLICGAGDGRLPYGEEYLRDFESRHCWDRFWCTQGAAPHTRYLTCGHALVVVGDARSPFFLNRERGVLAQFRHQHFMLFLLTHFQKAALLMYSDRLVDALRRLNVGDPENVRIFKREIRATFESFLRFTHRYWFLEVSEQVQSRTLHKMLLQHLDVQPLYTEIKARINDMAQYLEADNVRRQANTVVRLTVVTIFGLVGTITTGFLGMNLLAESDAPMWQRIAIFLVTLFATIWLTTYTLMKSKRLSDLLDALTDEQTPKREMWRLFLDVWRKGGD